MSSKSQNRRIIFGLKVKQLRIQKELSFAQLAKEAGMSVSYLNEIEKGKKYPKEDKIKNLASALDTTVAELTSLELSDRLAPVGELLKSNFLNELPLDLFGIELSKVVEMIANSPARVGAFISTLVDLARNYALREENFYFGALRSYLELHYNYFEEIEQAVHSFKRLFSIKQKYTLEKDDLKNLLINHYGYTIEEGGLKSYPELKNLRSLYVPKKKKLLLNNELTPIQQSFQFAKELAFNYMELKDRAPTSSLLKVNSFEQIRNHAIATYFAVALLMDQNLFLSELRHFFNNDKWKPEEFIALLLKFDATPEMFSHRFTNILPKYFGLKKMFFLRFVHDHDKDNFEIDKELHLNHRHHPHGNGLFEHYCRRWISLSMLQEMPADQKPNLIPKVGIQRSKYYGTKDEYLCFTIVRQAYPRPNQNVSITLGILLDEHSLDKVKFANDPAIPSLIVNKTCERCAIEDCKERASPATVINKRKRNKEQEEILKNILEE